MPTTFPLEETERLLGQWTVDYIAPSGCRISGQLAVTNWRVMFAGPVETRCLHRYLLGPVEARALAYALDLDTEEVSLNGERLIFTIPKAHVANLTTVQALFRHALGLTLKNNGSVHVFERHLLPIGALMRAIQAMGEEAP